MQKVGCETVTFCCPVPRGAGGLKYEIGRRERDDIVSRPARGGWIEMIDGRKNLSYMTSRPARGGWIEIKLSHAEKSRVESRPARGGWIEIFYVRKKVAAYYVPSREGRVD